MALSETESKARLERLSKRDAARRGGAGASSFVRWMRLVLPLAAIGIVASLFIAKGIDDQDMILSTAQENPQLPKEIVQNELLNPKFESRDKKNRPYEIIAARAVQGKANKNLIMLERPIGTMSLSDGGQVRVEARSGAYRQDTERFYLEGDVTLAQGQDYALRSSEAHVDLQESLAWTDKAVSGQGPDMMIEAQGLKANAKTGEIVFKGPTKLTLSGGFKGF